MMKKLLLIFASLVLMVSCGQKKNAKAKPTYDVNKHIVPEARDLTEKNFVEKLTAQIKHYPEEPRYYLRYNKQNCLIEIDVDEMNTLHDFKPGNIITPTEINGIYSSGKKKVTVKMYPIGNQRNEELGIENGTPETKLTAGSQVEVSIIRIDNKSEKRFEDEKVIMKADSPKDVAGKEYYEFSFTFDAKVPFQVEDLSQMQDISKLDQKLVEIKAVEFAKMLGQMYVNNDTDALLKINYPWTLKFSQISFYKKEDLEEVLKEYKEEYEYNFTEAEVKDYKITYTNDGRFLYLITKSQDPDLKDRSALFLKKGKEVVLKPSIVLCLPKGRDLATEGFLMR